MNSPKTYIRNTSRKPQKNRKHEQAKFDALKKHTMNLTFYKLGVFLLLSISVQQRAEAQTVSAKQTALITSIDATTASKDPNVGVFKTMESIRYGMYPGVKGVQLRLEQPTCSGQTGAIGLVNSSGEAWKYIVMEKAGTVVGEGDVGYNRRIQGMKQGAYLIHFTLANGTSAVDEFTIVEGKEITARLETLNLPSHGVGTSIEFAGSCNGANEFTWDFGDGTTAFGEAITKHAYQKAGNYTVTFKAANFQCHSTVKQFVTIANPLAQEKE